VDGRCLVSAMMTVPCWQVFVWRRGRWQLRSTHDTQADAQLAAWLGKRGDRFSMFHIRTSIRRVATYVQPPAPTDAQRFREQQSDQMVLRRQSHAYFKSGCNGTEVLSK
jgi:hypothetical protein